MVSKSVIHVVEDDQPMRDSLVTLLEEAGHKVRAYATAEDLLAALATTESGCVVSDVRMPGMDGLSLLRRLRASGSALPLILITGHGDISMAVTAMKAGAVDFLEKPFEARALLSAIGAALRLRSSDAEKKDVEVAHRRLEKLTSRESEVLEHLVTGKSNKEVAAELGISPRTVEFHRAHLMEKTQARGLPDLVRFWIAVRPPSESQHGRPRGTQ